jgi:hypothetical protein
MALASIASRTLEAAANHRITASSVVSVGSGYHEECADVR